jgi:hypothetical protein
MVNLLKSALKSISKSTLCVTLLATTVFWGQSASAAIIQTNANSVVTSVVKNDAGWIANVAQDEVDFWLFDITQDSWFSASIMADIVFGLSLYSGQVQQDPGALFNNSADFTDFAGQNLTYLVGTDPFTPLSGGVLDKVLLKAGSYTLAVGGNDVGFDATGQYQYQLSLLNKAVQQVPAPAPMMLMAFALVALFRQRQRHAA